MMVRWVSNKNRKRLKDKLLELVEKSTRVWLISPFVTHDGIEVLATNTFSGKDFKLITRLNDQDIFTGVVDPEAIALFQDNSGKARFYGNTLHAKLWLFDDIAVMGSANLTGLALSSNFELMAVIPLQSLRPSLEKEYSRLWNSLKRSERSSDDLRSLARRLSMHSSKNRFEQTNEDFGLEDYGGNPDVIDKKPSFGYWIKVNGLSGQPIHHNVPYDFQTRAHYEGGQTFPGIGPGGRGRPALTAGDQVILARIGRRDGKPDYCIYGRGIVDSQHRPGTDELPKCFQGTLDSDSGEPISRWRYIVWLRDIQIIRGSSLDAPWLSTINFSLGSEVIPGPWAQTGRKRLTREQYDVLSAALDEAFLRKEPIKMQKPEEVWWNAEIEDKADYISRTRLELGFWVV